MNYKNLDKRRLMFIKEEDYNFLTYNILIILNSLRCIEKERVLKDHRKLSFLIDFVSDKRLLDILEINIHKESKLINISDREYLNQSYTNAIFRIKTVNQLIFTLSNEGIVFIKDNKLEKLDISLVKNGVADDFFKSEIFNIERSNMNRLKSLIKRITIIDITTLLQQLYYNNGVLDEQIIN